MATYDKFIQEILPHAKQIESKYGIPTSVTIGQAIHESAGGTRTPHDIYSGQKSYNLFGVKGSGSAGSVSSWTWEVINGVKKNVVAKFRAYTDWGGSLDDYAKVLKADRYKKAYSQTDPFSFLNEVWKGGYATDPNYVKNVSSTMKTYNLTQYDGDGFVASEKSPWWNPSFETEVFGNGVGGALLPKGNGEKPPNTLFTIPIPMGEPIHVTKDGTFSVLLFLIGTVVLVLALYSMFLSNSPVGAIVDKVKG